MKITPSSRKPLTGIAAFTLIELLVVIAIIAVLAGLLFPAMGAVRNQARKASAKNDVIQIVNAAKNYYVEYGKYPLPAGASEEDYMCGDGDQKSGDNSAVMNILRSVTANDPLNPRQIRFLEVPNVKSTSDPKSGINTSAAGGAGTWVDPWGQPYVIKIDGDYDGSLSVGTAVAAGLATETVMTGVIAVSKGKPSETSTPTYDPVCSWR